MPRRVRDRDWLLYSRIGEAIRGRRLELGMTQAELADALDFARTSIANIETGRQTIYVDTLYEIAKALDTVPATLVPKPLVLVTPWTKL